MVFALLGLYPCSVVMLFVGNALSNLLLYVFIFNHIEKKLFKYIKYIRMYNLYSENWEKTSFGLYRFEKCKTQHLGQG